MKLLAIISISIVLSVYFLTAASYSDTGVEYLYVGLPSSPLDNEDSEDDIEEDLGPQEDDSTGRGKSGEAPQSGGKERYEDWYEPDKAYQ